MTEALHWTVPNEHPAFAGHFPGTPIVPGVLLLDRVLQHIADATGLAPEILDVRSVKFLSPARPGDEIVFEYAEGAGSTIRFDIRSGTRRIASGSVAPGGPDGGEVAD